jgi:hypothetical protein
MILVHNINRIINKTQGMDFETLSLVKLLLVAGLAWLSFRKVKRIEAHQQ